jgi:Domain of unknown function (DUF4331)
MSNHFTGLRLGPPAEDPRLDLTDLFAFQAPASPSRTVLILNSNTFGIADAFHPDAVYRINVDNDGDAETDVAFSVVFSQPNEGGQRATVYMATGPEARETEAVGSPIINDAEVSFGAEASPVTDGAHTFFAGSRSDPFFVDFAGILAAFNWKDGQNFTDLKDVDPFPWTGNDTLAPYNAFGIVLELPTSELGPNPSLGIWGRASVRRNGKLDHVDRAGHPTIASFFNTDETKEEYNRTEPNRTEPNRTGQRPRALPPPSHRDPRAQRGLLRATSRGRDRRGGPLARHVALRPTQAGQVPERPRADRPRRRRPLGDDLEQQRPE